MNLRIFKFGGASVKSAEGVKNLAEIVRNENGPLVIVMSAMGKTTNALESLLADYLKGDKSFWGKFDSVKQQHIQVIESLFKDGDLTGKAKIYNFFSEIEEFLNRPHDGGYNFCYDQLVSYGELISSAIVSEYLLRNGVDNTWVDIRGAIRTDANYREGNVDYFQSERFCNQFFKFDSTSSNVYVTQGFIGGTDQGFTTTLGREGSDYSAAILANLLNAESVTIWKDVDGVLNADPRLFPNTVKLNEVSFKEAIELAYCGAQIIHPKTIKPLQNKQISLYVKSFINPGSDGTLVYQTESIIQYPPILILKPKQVLISLTPKDFSFVIEDCLSKIFAILYKNRVKANLIQSSAISFSICVDDEEHFLPSAIEELNQSFSVRYNNNLELLTIRHYTDKVVEENTMGKEIMLEQKTRSTIRVVTRGNN